MPAYSGGTWTAEELAERIDEVLEDLAVALLSRHRHPDRDAEALREYLGWLAEQEKRAAKPVNRATA